ncbi:MAG: DRTGG domain-containing protein [Clostridia bacterium]
MKIVDIVRILNAENITGAYGKDAEISSAFGADLMSDVLAFVKPDSLILTGMVNSHVLRTAEMLEVRFIMFVRGKIPDEELIDMAKELDIVLFRTEYTMFDACGLLYREGLRGCTRNEP